MYEDGPGKGYGPATVPYKTTDVPERMSVREEIRQLREESERFRKANAELQAMIESVGHRVNMLEGAVGE